MLKRRIIIILVILIHFLVFGTIYINLVVLPLKIKSLLIKGIEDATHKKAALGSLSFNIFKGLVLHDLAISDDRQTFLTLKEGAGNILIPPLFFKKIIVPTVRLDSLTIFLERKADNRLNIMELFSAPNGLVGAAQNEAPRAEFLERNTERPRSIRALKGAVLWPRMYKNFNIFIYRIAVINSRVDFKDRALPGAFNKTAENLNLILRLSLPASVKFDFSSELAGALKTKLTAVGEYRIPQKELQAKNISAPQPQVHFSLSSMLVRFPKMERQMYSNSTRSTCA